MVCYLFCRVLGRKFWRGYQTSCKSLKILDMYAIILNCTFHELFMPELTLIKKSAHLHPVKPFDEVKENVASMMQHMTNILRDLHERSV